MYVLFHIKSNSFYPQHFFYYFEGQENQCHRFCFKQRLPWCIYVCCCRQVAFRTGNPLLHGSQTNINIQHPSNKSQNFLNLFFTWKLLGNQQTFNIAKGCCLLESCIQTTNCQRFQIVLNCSFQSNE